MTNSFEAFTQKFRNFVYYPTTVWTDFWHDFIHPTFYFGCNVQDARTENDVLHDVGSYGSQINRILNVLDMIVDRDFPEVDELTAEERHAIAELRDLHERADAAARRSQGEPPRPELAPSLQRT